VFDVQQYFTLTNIRPVSRADFVKLVAQDAEVWRAAIQAAQIKPED